jgi:hypothetical protein
MPSPPEVMTETPNLWIAGGRAIQRGASRRTHAGTPDARILSCVALDCLWRGPALPDLRTRRSARSIISADEFSLFCSHV